jgi:hypothetical protein
MRTLTILGVAAALFGSTVAGAASAAPAGVGARAALDYTIRTTTTDLLDAGTDANVEIRLNGTLASSGFVALDNDSENFERGRVDSFTRRLADLGTIRSADIWFDRAGSSPHWHLSHVTVTAPGKPVVQIPVHQWFTSDPHVANFPAAVAARVYTIAVTTSEIADAGTDGNVAVRLRGSGGSSPFFELDTYDHNDFERGNTDVYERVLDSLGPLSSVDVRWDPAGDSPHWHLADVTVTVSPGGGRVEQTAVCPHHRWFAAFATITRNLPVV